MRVKVLAQGRFRVVAVMEGESCPVEEFLSNGEATTFGSRVGLAEMLQHVANEGLANVPSAWTHEANKESSIYEFKKGPLRVFYFEGKNGDIAVCTSGIRKTGQKVDRQSVNRAVRAKDAYFDARRRDTLEVVSDDC